MTGARALRHQILDLHADLTAACADTAVALDQLQYATDELLLTATWITETANESAEDIRQSARGNKRVSCQWCDGDFHVDRTDPGPHTCWTCRHCDGY